MPTPKRASGPGSPRSGAAVESGFSRSAKANIGRPVRLLRQRADHRSPIRRTRQVASRRRRCPADGRGWTMPGPLRTGRRYSPGSPAEFPAMCMSAPARSSLRLHGGHGDRRLCRRVPARRNYRCAEPARAAASAPVDKRGSRMESRPVRTGRESRLSRLLPARNRATGRARCPEKSPTRVGRARRGRPRQCQLRCIATSSAHSEACKASLCT